MGVTLRVTVGTAFALAVTCGLDGSANNPGTLERVDGRAAAPPWAAKPTVAGLPSLPSALPLPVLYTFLQFCVCQDGRPLLGTPALTEESWRTVWYSPKSSCLSWFIKSTTQGV